MRRYVVRFLVAILTFGLGVGLSLAFGLFKFQNTHFGHRDWKRTDCPQKVRLDHASFLTVDNNAQDPLRLVYLGYARGLNSGEGLRMRFAVTNRSDKVVSGFSITASDSGETKTNSEAMDLDWTALEVLEAGETSTISLPRHAQASSLRVAKVNFANGSVWINPRLSR